MPYDDQIIIQKVVSDNERAPVLRAEINIAGQKYKAGLWPWTRKDGSEVRDRNGNLQYQGKVEVDDYQGNQGQPPQDEPPPDDSEIPF